MALALRKADRDDLRRGLQKAIKAAARPTLRAVQDSARGISTKGIRRPGAKHPFSGPTVPKGTREKIAGAVVADVRLTGDEPRVRFRVAASRLPSNIRALPRKFDDGGTFRHPVMGNRDVWVSQTGDPWFWPPIRDHIKDFRSESDKALDDVRRKLEAGCSCGYGCPMWIASGTTVLSGWTWILKRCPSAKSSPCRRASSSRASWWRSTRPVRGGTRGSGGR